MAVLVVALATGCSESSPEASEGTPSEAISESGRKIFEGTPSEYATLIRACLEEQGVETEPMPGAKDAAFGAGIGELSIEEYEAIREACSDEVGDPQTRELTEGDLQERYDARVEQFACLVEEHLVSGEPISFEQFVDDYQRSGQQLLWEPTERASMRGNQGPADVCPRLTW